MMPSPEDVTTDRFANKNEYLKPKYGAEVLIGNWQEQRMRGHTDHKAITPGIYGVSSCINGTTVYHENFKPPVPKKHRKGIEEFLETKHTAFCNKLRSLEVNYKHVMDDVFLRNMTSMKDVKFRMEPMEMADMPTHPLSRIKPRDPLNRYGNLTETGLLRWKRCEEWREQQNRIDKSVYQNTYVPKRPVPNKPQPKCPRNPFKD